MFCFPAPLPGWLTALAGVERGLHPGRREPPMTALVPKSCARALLNRKAEEIDNLSDTGELRWVFDVAQQGAIRRCPRYWLKEIQSPNSVRGLDFAAAFALMVPLAMRSRLATEEVVALLCSSRPSVWYMITKGEVRAEKDEAGRYWIEKASLYAWLQSRWINGR